MMDIMLNGETKSIQDGLSVADLLDFLHIPSAGTAVACNDALVRKAIHAETILHNGDRVEIIRAVAGG